MKIESGMRERKEKTQNKFRGLTENEEVQTLIRHVLVNQHSLVSMNAASD